MWKARKQKAEMRWSLLTSAATGALLIAALPVITGGCATEPRANDPAQGTEARAVKFLQREVPAWSRDNGCFSCHNNGDAARALYAASRQGYRFADSILADTTRWLAAPAQWADNKGDPGFSDQRLADVQFAAALLAARETGHASDRAALDVAARRLLAQQAPDGSWPIDVSNAVGSAATYGTALATVMAGRTLQAANSDEARPAIERANRWLTRIPLHNTPNAAAVLLWSNTSGETVVSQQHHRALAFLRLTQATDGGWGPYGGSPAEVFDTALALLALSEHRAQDGVREMIRRARAFLSAQQLSDGSWPATTRPPGGVSYAQQMSTTAWATLALLATRPDAP